MTRKVLPKMLLREKRSAIINLSSITGLHPCGNISIYAASKAFTHSLSNCIDIECKGTKIDNLCLLPGGVTT